MFEIKSVGDFHIKGRGRVLTSHSPVTCERTTKAFVEQTGPEIIIDSIVYKIKAVEMFMPGSPLAIGEPIGILV